MAPQEQAEHMLDANLVEESHNSNAQKSHSDPHSIASTSTKGHTMQNFSRKAARKDDGLWTVIRPWIVEHQIGKLIG